MKLPPADSAANQNYWLADLEAQGLDSWRWQFRWTRPEVYFVKRLRAVERWRNLSRKQSWMTPIYLFIRFRFGGLSERFGFTIPLGVFGPGLSIAHLGTIVINADAKVGRDCRLHHGVTIGATRGLAPTIGDEVFLGPGSSVYGGVTIGNRVHIGPGVVVLSSVPDDSVIIPSEGVIRTRTRPTWRDEVRARATSDSGRNLPKLKRAAGRR